MKQASSFSSFGFRFGVHFGFVLFTQLATTASLQYVPVYDSILVGSFRLSVRRCVVGLKNPAGVQTQGTTVSLRRRHGKFVGDFYRAAEVVWGYRTRSIFPPCNLPPTLRMETLMEMLKASYAYSYESVDYT